MEMFDIKNYGSSAKCFSFVFILSVTDCSKRIKFICFQKKAAFIFIIILYFRRRFKTFIFFFISSIFLFSYTASLIKMFVMQR